jgi:hypothetical protein
MLLNTGSAELGVIRQMRLITRELDLQLRQDCSQRLAPPDLPLAESTRQCPWRGAVQLFAPWQLKVVDGEDATFDAPRLGLGAEISPRIWPATLFLCR